MVQYVWLVILIAAIIVEISIPGLVSIWFVPAALISMILAVCNVPLYLQITVFLGISLILIIFSRTIWKKYISVKPVVPTNADAVIGKIALVTESINNITGEGEVKINGMRWSARSKDGNDIIQGEKVTVVSIEGVKLICEKAN